MMPKIKVPSRSRYKIYESYLLEALADLQKLGKEPNFGKRMQIALRDNGLMEDLAEILDEYVICGVSADLGRCRLKLKENPYKDKDRKDFKDLKDLNEIINLNDAIDFRKEPDQKKAKLYYENYFNWFILADAIKQNGREVDGRTAFYERHPRIKHAVTTLCRHFVENIREACERLDDDWDSIIRYFFASDPKKSSLVKITPTGSDFHKGGKQVLILTFKTGTGNQKLVYKPGDIELDYRLLGDTSSVPNNAPWAQVLGNQKSIWELTNELLNDEYKLPTYKILPRHPGSSLNFEGQKLPISKSYGYLEFLSHYPEAKESGEPQTFSGASDWVTSDQNDVRKFYRQWGRILALAFIFSNSDIHLDNVIVHNRQPHLIDAEIAFTGPMDDVTGTIALTQTVGALREEAIKSPKNIRRRDRDEENTANLFVHDEEVEQLYQPSKNKLYFPKNGKFEKTSAKDHIVHLGKGFLELLQAFRKNKNTVRSWLEETHLENVVARFTPMSTADFSKMLRFIYSPKWCSHELKTDKEPFIEAKKGADDNWTEEVETKWPSPRPNYAILTDRNAFLDYLNCDVPAFYHRLGGMDLLNSRGEVVDVKNPPGPPSLGREHYFPASTLSFVEDKIKKLDPIDFTDDLLKKLIAIFMNDQDIAKFLRG